MAFPSRLRSQFAERLRRGLDEGLKAYGDLGLAAADYEQGAAERMATIQHQRDPGEDDDAAAGDLLGVAQRAALGDLYLALACDHGRATAWETLVRIYEPRLIGLARHRGLGPDAAEALARELLGELALPPLRGGARTRMGTYLGAGSLFGWLALILVRRIGAAARQRPTLALLEADEDPACDGRAVATQAVADAISIAAAREDVRRVQKALGTAWEALSPRERIVLVWRHADGLSQQEIARRLALGEPRVSRILGGAMERLRGAAEGALEERELPEPGDPFWTGLQSVVAQRLAVESANRPAPPWAGRRGPAQGRGAE